MISTRQLARPARLAAPASQPRTSSSTSTPPPGSSERMPWPVAIFWLTVAPLGGPFSTRRQHRDWT